MLFSSFGGEEPLFRRWSPKRRQNESESNQQCHQSLARDHLLAGHSISLLGELVGRRHASLAGSSVTGSRTRRPEMLPPPTAAVRIFTVVSVAGRAAIGIECVPKDSQETGRQGGAQDEHFVGRSSWNVKMGRRLVHARNNSREVFSDAGLPHLKWRRLITMCRRQLTGARQLQRTVFIGISSTLASFNKVDEGRACCRLFLLLDESLMPKKDVSAHRNFLLGGIR